MAGSIIWPLLLSGVFSISQHDLCEIVSPQRWHFVADLVRAMLVVLDNCIVLLGYQTFE